MDQFALMLILPALSLLAVAFIPSSAANLHVKLARRFVTTIVGLQFVFALAFAVWRFLQGSPPLAHPFLGADVPFSIHFDNVTALMLVLVSFIGWVICRFSIRYLDGDPNQGKYFRWTAFTIGAVSLLVVSGNLLMFFACWVMTSFGLHRLLLHYPERPASRRAAWTKFTISRIGDCFLLTAIGLVYREFGTFQFDHLFASADAASPTAAAGIAWCLMLGAVTKSAQFPLHSWLPDTLETPTPVSALMHAGIVNAGGYLVIRLSPLIVQAPAALTALALIGTTTVCFAGVVMLTQTSIKRSLAYSTIAQMGFMMLQCGLGAFSAAMLHIIAHSLYKAHAFLNSGSVIANASKTRSQAAMGYRGLGVVPFIASALFALCSIATVSYVIGVNFAEKAGGFTLGFILLVAMTAWLWDILRIRDGRAMVAGLAVAPCLALLYAAAFNSVDILVSRNLPAVPPGLSSIAFSDVVIVFCGLLLLQWLLANNRGRDRLAPVYVHAANGFYVDAAFRRLLSAIPPFRV